LSGEESARWNIPSSEWRAAVTTEQRQADNRVSDDVCCNKPRDATIMLSFRSARVVTTRRLIHFHLREPHLGASVFRIAAARNRLESLSAARSFSEAPAATSTSSQAKDSTSSEKTKKKDDNPNIFLDNLGKIFLGTIGLIIGSLVRSSYGGSNRIKVREQLEEKAALDPLEVDDLRAANSELTPQVFRIIMEDLQEAFPQGSATYQEFVFSVRKTMCRLKGEAFTVELGHLVDRAVLAALHQQGKAQDEPLPLAFLLTSLSLGLRSTVDDRISILFEAMQTKNGNVTYEDVRNMVGYLQDTCQLAPDSQVVEGERKYPTQQYERGTPVQLVQWEGSDQDVIDLDAFTAIVRSKAVCAWGECYNKKKSPK